MAEIVALRQTFWNEMVNTVEILALYWTIFTLKWQFCSFTINIIAIKCQYCKNIDVMLEIFTIKCQCYIKIGSVDFILAQSFLPKLAIYLHWNAKIVELVLTLCWTLYCRNVCVMLIIFTIKCQYFTKTGFIDFVLAQYCLPMLIKYKHVSI